MSAQASASGLPSVLTLQQHLQPLYQLLPELLNKVDGPRKTAEQHLLQLEKIPGFCTLCLVRFEKLFSPPRRFCTTAPYFFDVLPYHWLAKFS
jgi:hypothetical protein